MSSHPRGILGQLAGQVRKNTDLILFRSLNMCSSFMFQTPLAEQPTDKKNSVRFLCWY
jgi:hypothetical protein